MSQSRLLPSWPPLALCPCGSENNVTWRTDGLGYYCGKKADGYFSPRRRRTYMKYPWTDLFDGRVHMVEIAVEFSSFVRTARYAAKRHGVTVTLERTDSGAVLQAHRLATRAA